MCYIIKHIISIIFIFIFLACSPLKINVDNRRNLAFLYNPSSSSLHPEFFISHDTDTTSLLMIKIFPYELLFNKANEFLTYMANVQIQYKLIGSGKNKQLIDSASVSYLIDMDKFQEVFTSQIKFKAKQPNKYQLKIVTTDLLKKTSAQTFLTVDKSSPFTRQNFLLRKKSLGIPIFDLKFSKNDIFTISHYQKEIDSLYITFYKNKFPIPQPPYSPLSSPPVSNYEPDSIWKISYNDTLGFQLSNEGVYHIRIDSSNSEGVTLFNFGESFPRVTTPEQLINPVAYLTSLTDFNTLKNQQNKKNVVDNFWLKKTDNIEIAREIIRIYYNRVFLANVYFTSYKEGWKTDRGMIYIIYGPPNIIYKSDIDEKWIYWEKRNARSVSFTFIKKEDDPFSDNSFLLQRDEQTNTHWSQAVDSWRKGKVFNF